MKRFIALLLALILCLGLCACGGSGDTVEATPAPTAAEATPTPIPETPAEKYHKQMLAALEGKEHSTPTASKAVTHWTDDQGISTYRASLLSNKWMARSPEEVKYIVYRTERMEVVGHYEGLSNGVPITADACVPNVDIKITNAITQAILAENSFRGSEPPQNIFDAEDCIGDYPDEAAIAHWVTETLDTLEASANAAALEFVQSYLQMWAYSSAELTKMLLEEGFSEAEAQYAIDNCGADWAQINIALAQGMLQQFPTTCRNALIEGLMDYNSLSKTEAAAAADTIDWNEQALAAAYAMLNDEEAFGYSPDLLYSWLHHEYGFEEAQAQYALDNVKTDWNAQAVKAAKVAMEYWDSYKDTYGELSHESMVRYLTEWYNFTEEQAAHGAKSAGLK